MSRLEPYRTLIRNWRRSGISYMEISRRLADPSALTETGLPPVIISGPSIFNFVRVRALRGLKRKVFELPPEALETFSPVLVASAQQTKSSSETLLDEVAAMSAKETEPENLFGNPLKKP